jgi:hypothetical protein
MVPEARRAARGGQTLARPRGPGLRRSWRVSHPVVEHSSSGLPAVPWTLSSGRATTGRSVCCTRSCPTTTSAGPGDEHRERRARLSGTRGVDAAGRGRRRRGPGGCGVGGLGGHGAAGRCVSPPLPAGAPGPAPVLRRRPRRCRAPPAAVCGPPPRSGGRSSTRGRPRRRSRRAPGGRPGRRGGRARPRRRGARWPRPAGRTAPRGRRSTAPGRGTRRRARRERR